MYEIECLNAEVDELSILLRQLAPSDWSRITGFKNWTVNDIVLHLYASDHMGIASTTSEAAFKALRGDMMAVRNAGKTPLEEHHLRFPGLFGDALLRLWIEQAHELSRRLAALAPDDKLPWAGPSMSVPSFAAARQMENWAHGQAIYDVLGLDRVASDRLKPIATLGVKTFKWAYVNRGLTVPGVLPQVRLRAPSGEAWTWNTDAGSEVVEGDALDFCQVVAQVRNVADTGLKVQGPVATEWMSIAQCFAGAPSDPPAPGTRRKGA